MCPSIWKYRPMAWKRAVMPTYLRAFDARIKWTPVVGTTKLRLLHPVSCKLDGRQRIRISWVTLVFCNLIAVKWNGLNDNFNIGNWTDRIFLTFFTAGRLWHWRRPVLNRIWWLSSAHLAQCKIPTTRSSIMVSSTNWIKKAIGIKSFLIIFSITSGKADQCLDVYWTWTHTKWSSVWTVLRAVFSNKSLAVPSK